MKYLSTWLVFSALSLVASAQSSTTFSGRESIDIRVATPGLFAKGNQLEWNLASFSDQEYVFPLPGGKVISGYKTVQRKNHSGVDIKTCAKDTIRCAFEGVVRLSKPYGAYGNVVVVRHPNGLETVYSHNFTNFVQVGDQLHAGDPIGLTGRTGRATTEHLHFETRVNGHHFDPNLLFDMESRQLHRHTLKCEKRESGVVVRKR